MTWKTVGGVWDTNFHYQTNQLTICWFQYTPANFTIRPTNWPSANSSIPLPISPSDQPTDRLLIPVYPYQFHYQTNQLTRLLIPAYPCQFHYQTNQLTVCWFQYTPANFTIRPTNWASADSSIPLPISLSDQPTDRLLIPVYPCQFHYQINQLTICWFQYTPANFTIRPTNWPVCWVQYTPANFISLG